MKFFIFLLLLVYTSCSQNLSFMPKPFNFDSTVRLPKDQSEVIDSSLPYFKQFPIDSGKMCLKNGILISDKTAAEYVYYKSCYIRQNKELNIAKYLLNEYYNQSLAAEQIYKNQIEILEKENKRNWFEKYGSYIGFIIGTAAAILTEKYVFQASK